MLDWTDNRTPLFMAVPMYSDTQRNTLRNAWGWHMWKPTKILLWSLTYSRKNGPMLSQGELWRQYIWLLCVSTYVCVCLLQLLCDECWGIRDERAPLDGVNRWFIAAAASQPHIDLATYSFHWYIKYIYHICISNSHKPTFTARMSACIHIAEKQEMDRDFFQTCHPLLLWCTHEWPSKHTEKTKHTQIMPYP